MPTGITAGADGNLWFTDGGSTAVGRATPNGTINEFTPGLLPNANPDGITTGPDGNVWFTDTYAAQRAVGRITPSGAITEFHNGLGTGLIDDITTGADGNLWVEQSSPGGIARITTAGVITQFTNGLLPGAGSDGDHIVSGPDGNLWFNDRGSKSIGKVALQLRPAQSWTRPLPCPGPSIHSAPRRA
jgi:streptogramin lyase